MVEFPTHVSEVDHEVEIEVFYEAEIVVLNTYISDHDAVRVKISKKDIGFMITSLKVTENGIHLEYF